MINLSLYTTFMRGDAFEAIKQYDAAIELTPDTIFQVVVRR